MLFIMDYLNNISQIMTVVIVAEFVRRSFRILYEYVFYSNNYMPKWKLLAITKRAFGMNYVAFVLYLVAAFMCAISNETPPATFFIFMPLYWVFMGCGMANSHLYYADRIRQSHGLDCAEGMASNYFHGYLRLILPTHTGNSGIKERMELYEKQHNIKFAIKRLLILVPNTMFINSKIESKMLTKDGVMPLETVIKNRAGVTRNYNNDVYRFNIPINGTYYYIVLEGATPMLSFFETLNFEPTTTWQMKEMSREILLKFYKYLKYLLSNWPETQGKAELVLYNSYKSNGRPQDVGEVLLSHITNVWNEGDL